MRTSRSISIAILFLAVMLIMTLAPAHAVKYQAGVSNGDSTYYALTGSSAAGATTAHAVVVNVAGSNVTEAFTYYYPGGPTFFRFFWIDVFSGSSWNFSSNLFFVIATGLQAGDAVFSNWTNMTVTGPQSGPCGGTARQADAMGYIRNNQIVQAHWDRSTGILCDYQVTDPDPAKGTVLTMVMTNTTLWTSSTGSDVFTVAVEVSSFLGVPLLVLIVFVYFRRRRQRRFERSSK